MSTAGSLFEADYSRREAHHFLQSGVHVKDFTPSYDFMAWCFIQSNTCTTFPLPFIRSHNQRLRANLSPGVKRQEREADQLFSSNIEVCFHSTTCLTARRLVKHTESNTFTLQHTRNIEIY